MNAPTHRERICDLVAACKKHIEAGALPSPEAKPEAQTQSLLVDPFLEALGWSRNPSDTEHYVKEYGVSETRQKWTDYALLIDNTPIYFVESKSLFEKLDSHVDQLVGDINRFNRENPRGLTVFWGILTNFAETRVYYFDDSKNPVLELQYTDYESRFNMILDLLSPSGVPSHSLEKYLRETARRPLDDEFLSDLKRWRVIIANGYLNRNPSMTEREVGEVSHRVLSRLILARVLENAGTLPYAWLLLRYRAWQEGVLGLGKTFSQTLREAFAEFWDVFDTELFRPCDTDSLEVDDDFLREVIKVSGQPKPEVSQIMGDPQTRLLTKGIYGYNFDLLTVDVMGSVYERYLGYRVAIVKKPVLQVTIEESAEKRKGQGAYYTGATVARYIVESALRGIVDPILGESISLLDGHRFEEAHNVIRRLNQVKVLDPAFGSGSFLLQAFDLLCECYSRYNDHLKQISKTTEASHATDPDLQSHLDTQDAIVRNYPESILVENIYGVDKDPQAVEICKLNLWARLHEQWRRDQRWTRFEQRSASNRKHALPDLSLNLRVGNSLVFGVAPEEEVVLLRNVLPEIAERRRKLANVIIEQTDSAASIDESYGEVSRLLRAVQEKQDRLREEYGVRLKGQLEEWESEPPTNWVIEFPEVFFRDESNDRHGFDCIIGNPPYVSIYNIDEKYRRYFSGKTSTRPFETAYKKFDLYVLFMELAIRLLRTGGRMGFITPDKYMYVPYGELIRRMILDRTRILKILDLSGVKVFPDSSVETVITVLEAARDNLENTVEHLKSDGTSPIVEVALTRLVRSSILQGTFKNTAKCEFRFALSDQRVSDLVSKIKSKVKVSDILYVNWGLRTGTEELTRRLIVNTDTDPASRKLIRGEDVLDRYLAVHGGHFIIYDTEMLYNPLAPEIFESPKIVIRKISGAKGLFGTLDLEDLYCFQTIIVCVPYQSLANSEYVSPTREQIELSKRFDIRYVLGVINSKPIRFYYESMIGDRIGVGPAHVQGLPIPEARAEEQRAIAGLVDEIIHLKMSAHRMIELVPSDMTVDVRKFVSSGRWGITTLSDTKLPENSDDRRLLIGRLTPVYEKDMIILKDDRGEVILQLSFEPKREAEIKAIALMIEKWLWTYADHSFKGQVFLMGPANPFETFNDFLKQMKKRTAHDNIAEVRARIDEVDRKIDAMVGSLFGLTHEDQALIERSL